MLRKRVLDVARESVCESGWNAVNMSQVARRVEVSRPTLYHAVGTRRDLAIALVEHETDEFLAGVAGKLDEHPDDAVAGLVAAAEFTLHAGADNALLRMILAGEPHTADGLLPLVATETEPVLARAVDRMQRELSERYGPVPDEAVAPVLSETFVRLTLSHLLQPRGSADVAVRQIATVVAALAGGVPSADGDRRNGAERVEHAQRELGIDPPGRNRMA